MKSYQVMVKIVVNKEKGSFIFKIIKTFTLWIIVFMFLKQFQNYTDVNGVDCELNINA